MEKVYRLVLLWIYVVGGATALAQCPPSVSIRISQAGQPDQLAFNSFCQGEQVQLNVVGGQPGLTYQWKRNGENLPNGTSATYLAGTLGYYTVTAQGSNGCTVTSLPATLEVSDCQSTGQVRIRGVYLEDFNGDASVIGFQNPFLRLGFLTYKTELNKFPSSIQVKVYQKSNNQLISTLTLQRVSRVERNLLSLEGACGIESTQLYDVLYFLITPSGDPAPFNFDPAIYNHPEGYYLVSDGICCREPSDNIYTNNSQVIGYMELSARGEYNISTRGSMFGGAFNLASKVETCSGQPLKIDYLNAQNLAAITRVSNALIQSTNVTRVLYSLVAPGVSPTGSISYVAGFSATNFAGSNLQIDPNTGTITGTPTRPGKYVYVIRAETFNGNTRLSEIRRELQLIVKECPNTPQPTLTLTEVGVSTPAKNPFCDGQKAQLNAVGGIPGATYQWQLDGVNIAGATSSTLLVDKKGTYTVSVTKDASCPPFALSDPLTVSVNSPSVTLALGSAAADCQSPTVQLQTTAQVNDAASRFNWFLNGSPLSGVTGNIYSTSVTGQYTVQVTQPNGCTALSLPVSISPATALASPNIFVGASSICPGGAASLSAAATPGFSYQWLLDGQPLTGATSNVLSASQTGSYTLRIQTVSSCSALSKPVVLSAFTATTVSIKGEAQICPGSSTSLSLANQNQSTLGWQFFWQRNGTTVGTLPIYQATTAGTYRLRITDANGCSAVSPDWLIIEQQSVTVQIAPLTPVCISPATPVTLSATPAGGTFSGPGVFSGQFNPAIAGTGTHQITYTVTGSSSCLSGSATQPIEVRSLPSVTLPPQLTTLSGTPVILAPVNPSGPAGTSYTYSWSPPGTLNDPTLQSPTATPTQTTTYQLQMRDEYGCATQGTLVVQVIEPLVKLFVPNAFTPNNDGRNDTWQLWGAEQYPQIDVTVFNRWGSVIFHSVGYQVPFDGMYRGERVPPGLYTYLIRYDAREEPLRGTLMVLY